MCRNVLALKSSRTLLHIRVPKCCIFENLWNPPRTLRETRYLGCSNTFRKSLNIFSKLTIECKGVYNSKTRDKLFEKNAKDLNSTQTYRLDRFCLYRFGISVSNSKIRDSHSVAPGQTLILDVLSTLPQSIWRLAAIGIGNEIWWTYKWGLADANALCH